MFKLLSFKFETCVEQHNNSSNIFWLNKCDFNYLFPLWQQSRKLLSDVGWTRIFVRCTELWLLLCNQKWQNVDKIDAICGVQMSKERNQKQNLSSIDWSRFIHREILVRNHYCRLQPQCVLWLINGCIYYAHGKIRPIASRAIIQVAFPALKKLKIKMKIATVGDVSVIVVLMVIVWRKHYYYYQQQSMHCVSLIWKKEKLWFNLAALHDAYDE